MAYLGQRRFASKIDYSATKSSVNSLYKGGALIRVSVYAPCAEVHRKHRGRAEIDASYSVLGSLSRDVWEIYLQGPTAVALTFRLEMAQNQTHERLIETPLQTLTQPLMWVLMLLQPIQPTDRATRAK